MKHIFSEMAAAMHANDVDRYTALLDDDFQYVRHKSNDTLNRGQMAVLLRKVWGNGNRTIEDMRCIYENEDILVIYTRLSYMSGSREGAMIVNLKKNGKVIRTESGVSDLT